MDSKLKKWNGLHWKEEAEGVTAYCPKHTAMKLDALDGYGELCDQHSFFGDAPTTTTFVCPADNEQFTFNNDIWTLRRRFKAFQDSKDLKGSIIEDLDNIYSSILKQSPKPKDERYSVQVEIDETPSGKKLVIYAADRQQTGKTQIFIDPESDKISFDPTDIHPNMIFSKVVAYFKDDKSATLEDKS